MGDGRGEPFVGRGPEVARLRELLEAAVADGPRCVLMVGEPGIGKSSLVGTVARTRPAGVAVLRGEARADIAAPFGLWTGVRRQLGLGTGPDVETDERRWALLEELTAALGGGPPTVLVLEDVHWADDASIWVLDHVLQVGERLPLLVLATTRDEGGRAPSLAGLRRRCELVELAGLDAAAVADLAGTLRRDGVDADALVDRTGGNPLFLRELLVRPAERRGLPTAVADALAATLERLDAEGRRVLAALALAGSAAPGAVLATALGLEPGPVADHLDAAARLDVVRLDGGRAAFRHALLEEAATATLGPAERRALHSRLAAAWHDVLDAGSTDPTATTARATHLLAALPDGDAAPAATAVLDAVGRLGAADDPGAAAALATRALHVFDGHPGLPLDLHARLALEAAAALEQLGEGPATATYERAIELCRGLGDPVLLARAEVGAARFVNPFVPDPDRTRRMAAVERALPDDPGRLRAEVLGRLCVLHSTSPDEVDAGHLHGDAAVAVARRLDDPGALAAALSDRYLVPVGADDGAKRAAGEELLALGERTQRSDVLLQGAEWLFASHLDQLDLAAAHAVLCRMEAYAQLVPGPRWRCATGLRRSVLEALAGRREDALDELDRAVALAGAFQAEGERAGIDVVGRTSLALLWGRPDDALAQRWPRVAELQRDLPPVPFFEISHAMTQWALDDRAAGTRCLERYGTAPERVRRGMHGPGLLHALGTMAADDGDPRQRAGLRAALAPFHGRLGTAVAAFFHAPVDTTLGRLALLDGDVGAALAHHRTAVDLSRAAPSPPLLARALAHLAEAQEAAGDGAGAAASRAEATALALDLGLVLPPSAAAVPTTGTAGAGRTTRTASLERSGDGWSVATPYGAATVAASVGMGQLARVLAAGGREVAAVDLVGMRADDGTLARDLGPALDARAKRAYRRRVGELQAELDDAEVANDLERASRARLELDALLDELRRAVGLGGRDRPTGSGAERARVSATRNLRRAIAAVGAAVPALGAHLEVSVRTGRFCAYVPDPAAALTWDVTP